MNLPNCRWWTPAIAGLLAWFLSACSGGGGDGLPVTMTLTAVTASPGEISLRWTAHPGGVLGYDIMRDGEAAHPYHLSGTSYIDNNLNAATGYCYVVYAVVFPLGTMGRSNRACLTTPATAGWVLESIDSGGFAALALDSNDLPRVSYLRSGGVAHALRHGDGWLRTPVDGEAIFNGDTSLAVDRFNFDQLSYFDYTNGNLRHAANTLGSWASSTVDSRGGFASDLAVDYAGKAHLAYGIQIDSTHALFYASNASGSWQNEFVAGFGNSIRDTEITVDAAGGVHIAYAVGNGLCTVRYAHKNAGGGEWSDTVIDDTGTRCGASLALDQAGGVHIAYPRQFALIHASNASGSWQSAQLDDFSWIGGERIGLAIDAAGHLHIAYQDQNADLKYATDVSGDWQRYFLDVNGKVGAYPSIAVTTTGRVYITYIDESNGTVKLATSPW